MIIKKDKSIGIWGFGIVGKAAVNYFHVQGYQLGIMDKRNPHEQEQDYIKEKKITWYYESQQELFFNSYDFIIPSPGININPDCYATHKDKWLFELDFFYSTFQKPIIAITGSIGKTSTTYILNELFKKLDIPVAMGGNIGIPTFDLIKQRNNVDYALLEVSSFQLNHCKTFAPHLAIWTNLHPNHLDHHTTEDKYFLAKENIIAHQTKNHISLVHFMLRNTITPPIAGHQRSYFIATCPTMHELSLLTHDEQLYYIQTSPGARPACPTEPWRSREPVEGYLGVLEENNLEISSVMRYAGGIHTPIMELTPALHALSFIENILLITAVCDLLKLKNQALNAIATTIQLPEHRIEKISAINNVEFYNDSKATTTASTLAAIKKLYPRPLHLFLGGLSKGVDRAPFIAQLRNQVKHIYCFGKEAESLHAVCIANDIPATYFSTLDDAIKACILLVTSGDCVLLSPAGSSYDLYENYEQRGKHFKELVMKYIESVRMVRQAHHERE
ncbi:MAG TPA: UDP-N-acetylmuramoyl-L-alanine--D-glutamate ligase [Candidatus Babeliales bacterium]|jgi:UDP-N-acetylmuramoylalanine--D-glutamate ligase|nr:UDP-N-acetylmuramoyl-L-alanine--D-glutamate ligase [Candidatus Babeliales bacterium]